MKQYIVTTLSFMLLCNMHVNYAGNFDSLRSKNNASVQRIAALRAQSLSSNPVRSASASSIHAGAISTHNPSGSGEFTWRDRNTSSHHWLVAKTYTDACMLKGSKIQPDGTCGTVHTGSWTITPGGYHKETKTTTLAVQLAPEGAYSNHFLKLNRSGDTYSGDFVLPQSTLMKHHRQGQEELRQCVMRAKPALSPSGSELSQQAKTDFVRSCQDRTYAMGADSAKKLETFDMVNLLPPFRSEIPVCRALGYTSKK